jgi:hypothetical protein
VCTLIDAKEKNGMYNVEYTLSKTAQQDGDGFDRHLLQVVAIGTSGYYNRLYTVTGQVSERRIVSQTLTLTLGAWQHPLLSPLNQASAENYEAVKDTLNTVLASFVPPPTKI